MELLMFVIISILFWLENGHYAGITLDAPTIELCPKLCQHKNTRKPKQKSELVAWAIAKSFRFKKQAAFSEGTIQSFLSQTSVQNELN